MRSSSLALRRPPIAPTILLISSRVRYGTMLKAFAMVLWVGTSALLFAVILDTYNCCPLLWHVPSIMAKHFRRAFHRIQSGN